MWCSTGINTWNSSISDIRQRYASWNRLVNGLLNTAFHCISVKLNQYYLDPTSGLLRGVSYTLHVTVMTLSQGQRSLILVLY